MSLQRKFPLYNNRLKEKAGWLRKNSPLAEILLWNKLKHKQLLDYKFIRQKPIGKYIVDFYCHKLNLIIEIDGFSHNFKLDYDKKRDQFLQQQGFTILHLVDKDILKDINSTIQIIIDFIFANTPLPPCEGGRNFFGNGKKQLIC